MDNRESIAGPCVYLPVFNYGALFVIGEGYSCQGEGKSCLSALEGGVSAKVELIARKDVSLEMPRAKTPAHQVLMEFGLVFDNAAQTIFRGTQKFLGELRCMSREDAYSL